MSVFFFSFNKLKRWRAAIRRSAIWDIPKEEIQERVNNCNNISEMLDEFGYKRTSGSMHQIMWDVIKAYGIDVSHFNPFERKPHPKYSLDEILVPNSHYTNISELKKKLVRENRLEYKCAICGNRGIWENKPLQLQLDHINGDHMDHSIENLRFLCPNCHSQTDTYGGKNAKYGDRV